MVPVNAQPRLLKTVQEEEEEEDETEEQDKEGYVLIIPLLRTTYSVHPHTLTASAVPTVVLRTFRAVEKDRH